MIEKDELIKKGFISLNTVRNKPFNEKIKVIVNNANIIHNYKYDYSEIKSYTNDKELLPIICPKHGRFFQNYNGHVISQHGCPNCLGENNHNRTLEKFKNDFFKRVNEIYEGFYDFSEFNFINSNTKGKVICPIHGIFYKEPNKLLNRRQACSKCNSKKSKYEIYIEEFLNDNNIQFTTNKENLFEECISQSGNYLDFDFYIESKNILIEFDGSQHFELKFKNDIKELKRVHDCDLIRNKWALEHDITFIRFSYKLTYKELNFYLNKFLIENSFEIKNDTNKIMIISNEYNYNNGYYSNLKI